MDKHKYWVGEIDSSSLNRRQYSLSYYIVMLCTAGNVTFEANMVKTTINAGYRLCMPNVITLKLINVSSDFKALAFAIGSDYGLEMISGVPHDVFNSVFSNPIRKMEHDDDMRIVKGILEVMKDVYNSSMQEQLAAGITSNLFRSVLYKLAEVETKYMSDEPFRLNFSSTDAYYHKFMSLLNKYIAKEHEVAFYAEQLSITPKYLNEIVKQKTSKKAKELISNVLTARLKYEILNTGKSLKNISYEYNFADQSSLGKFFRKTTGHSPNHFRRNNSIKV